MTMAINVYEYARGWRCIYIFRYTYAEIRIIDIHIEREDRYMKRVMRITRSPCQRYVWKRKRRQRTNSWL